VTGDRGERPTPATSSLPIACGHSSGREAGRRLRPAPRRLAARSDLGAAPTHAACRTPDGVRRTHTIICRGKVHKPTEYGRKLFLAQGASGLITDFSVLEGNTADVTLVAPALEHHQRLFKRAPNEFAGDRGFFSAENVTRAEAAGVGVVSVPKPGYKSAKQAELERTREFRRGQRWRAGIEGTISALKRGRGLARCSWRGDRGLRVLVGLAIVTHNLTILSASFA